MEKNFVWNHIESLKDSIYNYVYLLCDPSNNTFKIGITRNSLNNRIQELQTGNSTEIHLVNYHETQYPFLVEKLLHNKYGHKKVINEWFKLDSIDVREFKSNCIKCEEIINLMKNNCFFKKEMK